MISREKTMADQSSNPHQNTIEPNEQPHPVNPLSGVQPFVNPQTTANTHVTPQTTQPLQQNVQHPEVQPHTPQSSHLPMSNMPPHTPNPESEKKRKAREKLKKLKQHQHFGTVRFAILSFVVFLLIFNFQIIYSQVVFWVTPKQAPQTSQNTPTTTPVQTTATTPAQTADVVGPENLLIIPKINVRAPILFINTLNETDMLRALQDGVVHYAGTANPGENGNAVFFGHSSNDWWEPGSYKFVFVLLEKLVPGDTYEIHYQSRRYVYQVTATKVVQPTDLSVLAQTDVPTSTLITCTPPGTSWRRFIVSGTQISPTPTTTPVQQASTIPATTSSKTGTLPSTLPSASPSIFSQVQSSISGFFSRFFGGSSTSPDNQLQGTPTQNHLPEVT